MSSVRKFLFLLMATALFSLGETVKYPRRTCLGTDFRGWERFSVINATSSCDKYYINRYTGCTHIVGNLEIISIQNDTSFLQDIEEISGYLLVYRVDISELTFPNLRLIQGNSLFRLSLDDPGYSLLTLLVHTHKLAFPALREISDGNVGIYIQHPIPYIKDVNWKDILEGEGAQFHYFPHVDKDKQVFTSESSQQIFADVCSASCQGGCWDAGADQCQKLSKTSCSDHCHGGRCFGPSSAECCHPFCAAGCSGPTESDCFSCKFVHHEGKCGQDCPENMFSFGMICVLACPRSTLLDEEENACLPECPEDKIEEDGHCRRQLPSEKKCTQPSHKWAEIHSGNIEHFQNCTHINGDIYIDSRIVSQEFEFFDNLTSRSAKTPIQPSQLEVFSTVREITGTLQIRGNFSNFTGSSKLSFFKNLEVIGNQKLHCMPTHGWHSLNSLSIIKSDFEEVNFSKLKMVRGDILIVANYQLCYVNTLKLTSVLGTKGIFYINNNMKIEDCQKAGRVCSSACTRGGCWGRNAEDCMCEGYRQEDRCFSNCNMTEDYLTDGHRCVWKCPIGKFEEGSVCRYCHGNCEGGCTGNLTRLGDSGCHSCRYKFLRYANGTVNCMGKREKECPTGFYADKQECLPFENTHIFLITTIICGIGGGLLLIAIAIGITIRYCKRPTAPKKATEFIPLVSPNLSKFRIIEEKNLRRDEEMGSGAFGEVYRGIWMPEEKKTLKIPVAIKVLRGAAGSKESTSLVDEAYLMAGVQHPNLLQLLALCLSSSKIMLVTQLMPLGCLQKYMRDNKDKIGAGTMLSWSTQIAKGMEYLESHHYVHRDLAARNVLVETPSLVKITDFGLAKLLGIGQEEYQEGGRMLPIKWLALESLKTQTFSHKSDVWAFGVTVWEILTCGGTPYAGISPGSILPMLEGGGRLEQPENCTLEMRMILVKTSMPDPESRPSFSELVTKLEEMCKDPCRYINIPENAGTRLPQYTREDELQLLYSLASKQDKPEELITIQDYAMLPAVLPILDESGYLVSSN